MSYRESLSGKCKPKKIDVFEVMNMDTPSVKDFKGAVAAKVLADELTESIRHRCSVYAGEELDEDNIPILPFDMAKARDATRLELEVDYEDFPPSELILSAIGIWRSIAYGDLYTAEPTPPSVQEHVDNYEDYRRGRNRLPYDVTMLGVASTCTDYQSLGGLLVNGDGKVELRVATMRGDDSLFVSGMSQRQKEAIVDELVAFAPASS